MADTAGVEGELGGETSAAAIPAEEHSRPSVTVLIVDDEPRILNALRRSLHVVRPDWRVVIAVGGCQALEVLAGQPVHAVVSDMRMPGMNGAELLTRVGESFPTVARIILSGYSDPDSAAEAAGVTDEFLAKPCDGEVLVEAVDRLLTSRV